LWLLINAELWYRLTIRGESRDCLRAAIAGADSETDISPASRLATSPGIAARQPA
jgi:hypothetical protein